MGPCLELPWNFHGNVITILNPYYVWFVCFVVVVVVVVVVVFVAFVVVFLVCLYDFCC